MEGNRTLVSVYKELDVVPTPKIEFVRRIAKATKKAEHTVRMWVSGKVVPDALTRSTISKELGIPEKELFPQAK